MIVNDPDNRFDQTPFTRAQIDAAIALGEQICERNKISPELVLGHRDIAPDRKPDPGKLFPWQELAKHGLGVWPQIQSDDKSEDSVLTQEEITAFLINLERFGYGVSIYGANPVIAAYQCRFTPNRVTTPSMGKIGEAITTAPLLKSDLLRSEALVKTVYA